MYTLSLFFEDEQKSPAVLSRVEAGQTLLEVFLANGIDVPHRCGGICHCTTCHLYIEKGEQFLAPKERREADFLRRTPNRKMHSRLACQCLLSEGRGEVVARLPQTASTNNGNR